MTIVLYIVLSVLLLAMLIVLSVDLEEPEVSQFELKRRVKANNKLAQLNLDRIKFQSELLSLRLVSIIVMAIFQVTILIALFDWLTGLVLSLILLFILINLSRFSPIKKSSKVLYLKVETKLINFIKSRPNVVRLFRLNLPTHTDKPISSREELSHVLARAKSILSTEERSLITNGLVLDDQSISTMMIVRDKIPTIKHNEVLGPLVLNDLHKTGERLFLVINKDLDHVLGTLDISDQLVIGGQTETKKASDVMDRTLVKIAGTDSIKQVLLGLIDARAQVAVVTNDQTTIGVVYLHDIVNRLFGRD